jgi:hypothetical protein
MQDELDRWIDGALATYSSAEPLAGLEERILHRVRRPRRWWWGLAIPAAAAIALAVAIPRRQTLDLPLPVPPPAVAVVEARPAPPPVQRHRAIAAALPKLASFPSASPLTAEERLLLQFARSHAEELVNRPPADEIEIKPIEIAPLQSDGSE